MSRQRSAELPDREDLRCPRCFWANDLANRHQPEATICLICNVYVHLSGFFFGHISARTFIRNVIDGLGGHNSTVGVTLPEVWARSVQCVARGKPVEIFWPWAWIRQVPGFPRHSASCARTKGIYTFFYGIIPFARAPDPEVTLTFGLFFALS